MLKWHQYIDYKNQTWLIHVTGQGGKTEPPPPPGASIDQRMEAGPKRRRLPPEKGVEAAQRPAAIPQGAGHQLGASDLG